MNAPVLYIVVPVILGVFLSVLIRTFDVTG